MKSMFSLNDSGFCFAPRVEATTSVETPARSHQRLRSRSLKTRGTSAARGARSSGRIAGPDRNQMKWRRFSRIDRPPVATTRRSARSWRFRPPVACTVNWPCSARDFAASFLRTSFTFVLSRISTPASRHSCSSIAVMSLAARSQNNWPSFFS